MMTLEKRIEVAAPVEQVFAYLLDPAHVPEYAPNLDEVKDIQRLCLKWALRLVQSRWAGRFVY